MRKIIFILFMFSVPFVHAQYQKVIQVPAKALKSNQVRAIHIEPDFEFSSVSVSAPAGNQFNGAYIVAANDTFWLHRNEDYLSDSAVFSHLIVLPKNETAIYFYRANLQGNLKLHFLNAYTTGLKALPKPEKKNATCLEEPASISQEEWRAGLLPPNYERSVHEVHNLIVHHSAGSNTDTNYVNVIRNIYVYHTQSLLWSDIGYNYVIAQNGQLFKARDPGEYAQDNVKGAHFCASNTGTMGVCLLGNYEEVQPSDTALKTLVRLLAWKSGKDSTNAYSVFRHPLNPALNYISGHRDGYLNGCATLCPGLNLYKQLPSIRKSVDSLQNACDLFFDIHVGTPQISQTNPDLNIDHQLKTLSFNSPGQIQLLTIYKSNGSIVLRQENPNEISFHNWIPGLYVLVFVTKDTMTSNKVLLY